MIDRRAFIQTLAVTVLSAPLSGEAQPPAKVPRIGFLSASSPSTERPRIEAFQQGLRKLGYIERQNIVLEYRWAEGKFDRLAALATELVRLRVAVMVAGGELAIRAAKNATSTIPIVMAIIGDPTAGGLVVGLARPGGSVTGLSAVSPELSGKALGLLKEAFPQVSRVAILWNPANPAKVLDFKEAQAAAQALGIQLQSLEVRQPDDFDRAFGAATRERAEALSVRSESVALFNRKRIVEFAAKRRLPAIYELSEFVDAGGLMSYGPQPLDLYRRAAYFVDKILKGAKPADLPIEQPTKFELVINLKTAKAIGLTIPQSILIRADRIIE